MPQVSHEPEWPESGGRRVVFLLDASSTLEQRLLEDWVAAHRPAGVAPAAVEMVAIPPSRRSGRARLDGRLEASLATDDDPLLAPLRVAWMPAHRNGSRDMRLVDLLAGDPRDPGRLRQAQVLRRHPDRCRIVAGDPAPVSDLRTRWQR